MTEISAEELIRQMWNNGLEEVFASGSHDELKAFLLSLGNGKSYVASWQRSSTPAPAALTSGDRDAIAQLRRDLSPVARSDRRRRE